MRLQQLLETSLTSNRRGVMQQKWEKPKPGGLFGGPKTEPHRSQEAQDSHWLSSMEMNPADSSESPEELSARRSARLFDDLGPDTNFSREAPQQREPTRAASGLVEITSADKLTPDLLQQLKAMNPASLLYASRETTIPFIYDRRIPKELGFSADRRNQIMEESISQNGALFVGSDFWYHTQLIGEISNRLTGGPVGDISDSSIKSDPNVKMVHDVYNEYYNRQDNLIVGRIAFGLIIDIYPEKYHFKIYPSIYASAFKPEDLQNCLLQLRSRGIIPDDCYATIGDQVKPIREFIHKGAEIDDRSKKMGELQILLHLGNDPKTGNRLTPEQRENIEAQIRELQGNKTPSSPKVMRKHPMQAAAEKHQLVAPGNKWWAPTSEAFENNLERVLFEQ